MSDPRASSAADGASAAMQRRMASLFLLAVGLLAWQAPLTQPTHPPPSVRVTGPGAQLFPLAVPDAAPLPLPAAFLEADPSAAPPARPALTWTPNERFEGSDQGRAEPPPGTCTLLLRVSRYHWARRSLSPGELSRLSLAATQGQRTYHLAAHDFADDDDGDGDPLDPRELRVDPPGAEAEVECSPLAAAGSPPP